MIPGFVIAGAPRSVLVRAVGPTLGQFGVSGALEAPVLTLYDSDSRAIATNTRWTTATNVDALRGATTRVGAFALAENSADSALFVTLNPGAYTAQTAGSNETTGVALVEIYEDGSSVVRRIDSARWPADKYRGARASRHGCERADSWIGRERRYGENRANPRSRSRAGWHSV